MQVALKKFVTKFQTSTRLCKNVFTGMKIVQLLVVKILNEKFKAITRNIKMLDTHLLYNLFFFFPIADIISSIY
jgi:hypothetical protein